MGATTGSAQPARLSVLVGHRHPEDGWSLADPYPMSGATRRALRGLIRVLCPPPPGPELPDLEDRMEDHVRRMLNYMVPIVALGFSLAVRVVDWAPLWRFVAWSRIQKIDRARGERILTEMGESRSPLVRTMILGIRGIVLSSFYDQDEVHRAMRWQPLPFVSERVALRNRLLAGAVPSPEDHLGRFRPEDTP